ncbi:MAG: site-specific integrase [Muribaculum sp.]|nr:site-specific integrase [Muribaculum sp.]
MSSIKVKFRPSSIDGNEGSIYYRIIHDRIARQLSTDLHIYADEWDDLRGMPLVRDSSSRKDHILSVRERIRWDLQRLVKIERILEKECMTYTADDIISRYQTFIYEGSLFNYTENLIVNLKGNHKYRTAETYRAALNSFKQFRGDRDIIIDRITHVLMENYESWHKAKGNTQNTSSFYMRILRAIYNRAVEDELTENRLPFRHVYTGIDKTLKRALTLEDIKKIKTLSLQDSNMLAFARDIFILSFYLRGMSFIDMSFLRKCDLNNGHITYRRRKTGQLLSIAWTKEMQAIVDKYPKNPTKYLLPIIKNNGVNEHYAYRNALSNINHCLKEIANRIGIKIPLTMYVARHSWASAAKVKGIPISVISEGMGHDNENTTRIYLASLDTATIDSANEEIMKSL